MPTKLPTQAYPGYYLVRRVSNAGTSRFQTRQLFISDTLLQEDIALEETGDGIWSIDFYDVLLARLEEYAFRLLPENVSSMLPIYSVTDVPGCHIYRISL
jgi:hypothetical protein